MSTFTITSNTGRPYQFTICDLYGRWKELGGIYIFLKPSLRIESGYLYIGETENFPSRPMPPAHERWDEALRLGATMIAATVIENSVERKAFEAELIHRYQPPMNVQHRSGLVGNQLRSLLG